MELTPEAAAVLGGVVAVASALVRLVERLVDALIKKKGDAGCEESMAAHLKQTEDLWDWHNHDMPGQPGVKCWWSTALGSELGKLRGSIDRLSNKLENE